MGELREYFKTNLPKFEDPAIFISSKFIPGCPKCDSSASVYYITLTERDLIPREGNLEKAVKHKFPVDIYVQYPILKGKPKQFVIGTRNSKGTLEMVLNRIID
ncbi:MAG: hypothetical protein ACW98F_07440 [Candidatus Hodarchaeales archaeon]